MDVGVLAWASADGRPPLSALPSTHTQPCAAPLPSAEVLLAVEGAGSGAGGALYGPDGRPLRRRNRKGRGAASVAAGGGGGGAAAFSTPPAALGISSPYAVAFGAGAGAEACLLEPLSSAGAPGAMLELQLFEKCLACQSAGALRWFTSSDPPFALLPQACASGWKCRCRGVLCWRPAPPMMARCLWPIESWAGSGRCEGGGRVA